MLPIAQSGRFQLMFDPTIHPSVPSNHQSENQIISDNKLYRIQWVIPDFSTQITKVSSPIFAQTSVQIQIHLDFEPESGFVRLGVNFLQFPGIQVSYQAMFMRDADDCKPIQRSVVFEPNGFSDSIVFPLTIQHLLTDTYFLRTGLLVIKIDVAQPPFRSPIFLRTEGVTFENGVYHYRWTFGEGKNDFRSPAFQCGEVSVTVTLIDQLMAFKFKVRRELDIEICVSLKNTPTKFLVTGKVSPRNTTLEFRHSGLWSRFPKDCWTFTFGMKVSPTVPLPAIGQRNGSFMFQPSEPQRYFQQPSKKDDGVGIVGLSNLGMAAYLNSFLQILFHIPAFRRCVYAVENGEGVVLQVQYLFALMQARSRSCSARDLVRSFGTAEFELLHQMPGDFWPAFVAQFNGAAPLFGGEFISGEHFWDLSLTVKGVPDLPASFRLLPAKFRVIPPVLCVHLQRFPTDQHGNKGGKVVDRFEFPEELDLTEFVEEPQERFAYQLFAVVVHSGITEEGHYFTFVKLSMGTAWYKFNDRQVKVVEKDGAVDDNFGGETTATIRPIPKCFSASVLIYVRADLIDGLFAPVDQELPPHLSEYVAAIELQGKQHEDEEVRHGKVVSISVVTDDALREAVVQGGGLNNVTPQKIEMHVETTFSQLYEGFGNSAIRIWVFMNHHSAPNRILPNVDTATLTSLIENSANKSVRIYVQSKQPDELIDVGIGKMLIFASFFFPEIAAPVQFVGSMIADQCDRVNSVFPTLSRMIGSDSTAFRVYREGVQPKELKPDESFCAQFVENATMLVFEFVDPSSYSFSPIDLPEIREPEMDTTELPIHEYASVFGPVAIPSFLAYRLRAEAQLELASIDAPDQSIGILKVPIDISRRELERFIARVANIEYNDQNDTILIYTMHFLSKRPSMSLLDHLTPSKREKVYFSVVRGMNEMDLQHSRRYEVQFSADACRVTIARLVFAPNNTTFGALFDGLKRSVQNLDFGSGPFRYLIVSDSKIEEISTIDREISRKFDALRIEPTPPDQQSLAQGDVLLQVLTKRVVTEHEFPHSAFLALAKKGEPFRAVKERIRNLMGSHPQFDSFLFSLKSTKISLAVPLTDDSIIGQELSLESEIRINLPGRGRFAVQT